MLSSLFGDLGPAKAQAAGHGERDDARGFATTAVLQPPFAVHGQVDDVHAQNLFVTGSPAQAIREHFRHTRADLGEATQMVTLLDLSRRRASALLSALSEATGAPVERLQLREQGTLRTLALIERSTVQRRGQDTLKVYHADTRGAGSEEAEITAALMERSQLCVVLLEDVDVETALETVMRLEEAARHSTWRCPFIAFFLPPTAPSLARRIRAGAWPSAMRIEVVTEPARGSSALWNAMLALWEQYREQRAFERTTGAGSLDSLDAGLLQRVLMQLQHCEGVQACAIVDGAAGTLIAGRVQPGYEDVTPDLQRVALANSLALRAQQHAARTMGLPAVEELTVTAGEHLHIVRALVRRPGVFLLALLDRRRTNLALARFTLLEAEKSLD